jgi:hypothetical protein
MMDFKGTDSCTCIIQCPFAFLFYFIFFFNLEISNGIQTKLNTYCAMLTFFTKKKRLMGMNSFLLKVYNILKLLTKVIYYIRMNKMVKLGRDTIQR